MAYFRRNTISTLVVLSLTAISCSLPFIGSKIVSSRAPASVEAVFKSKPGRLSGVLVLHEGCVPGFYQIKLQGLADRSSVQVESQSDQSGHFSISAPTGKYSMSVTQGGCGVKQLVELEDNTDHMVLMDVIMTTPVDKEEAKTVGRLPASILVPAKRAPKI